MQKPDKSNSQFSQEQLIIKLSHVESEYQAINESLARLLCVLEHQTPEEQANLSQPDIKPYPSLSLETFLEKATNIQKEISCINDKLLQALTTVESHYHYTSQAQELIGRNQKKPYKPQILQENNLLLQAINFIQTQYIDGENTKTVFDNILQKLLDITRSEYGFVGKIVYPVNSDPFLKCYAITDISWNTETRDFFKNNAPQGLEFHNLSTLFGKVITTGEPVISNSPYTDPRRGGLPKGHPAMHAFLGIPLKSGDKLIGMLGIANRPGGYDTDLIQFLEPLLNSCTVIIQAVENIAERKQMKKILAESESRLARTEVFSLLMSTYVSLSGKWLKVPPSLCDLLGYSEEEMLSTNFQSVTHPDDIESDWSQCQRLIRGEIKSFDLEKRYIRKDGSIVWVYLNCSIVTDEQEMPVYFLTYIRDITERKLAEEKLREQNEELKKINAELDSFVYRASHDLRAPLVSILGLINIAQTETDTTQREAYFNLMTKSIHKLDIFIKDIIDYSKNSRLEIASNEVDFQLLITDIFDELKYTEGSNTVEKRIQLYGNAVFYSDIFRLKIIFNNIISNAIRYRNLGVDSYLHIDIQLSEDKAVLDFKDNGQGIADESLNRIFEMFYRASEQNVGSGLGLYIVKEIIDTLSGKIKVRSTLGKGTVFSIELPNQKAC